MNSKGSGSHPPSPAHSGKAAVPSGELGTVLQNSYFLPLQRFTIKHVLLLLVTQSYALRSVLNKLLFLSEQGRAAMFQRLLLTGGEGGYTATAVPLLSCAAEPRRQTGMLVSSINSIIPVQVGETRRGAAVQLFFAMPTS